MSWKIMIFLIVAIAQLFACADKEPTENYDCGGVSVRDCEKDCI